MTQPNEGPTDPSGIDEPHDVLAAEEFGIGTRDEHIPADRSGIQRPHDVLAAEEFGIGTREERVPRDPSGIREPHDVLAADEFPMPAGAEPHEEGGFPLSRAWVPLLLAVALALVLLRRRA